MADQCKALAPPSANSTSETFRSVGLWDRYLQRPRQKTSGGISTSEQNIDKLFTDEFRALELLIKILNEGVAVGILFVIRQSLFDETICELLHYTAGLLIFGRRIEPAKVLQSNPKRAYQGGIIEVFLEGMGVPIIKALRRYGTTKDQSGCRSQCEAEKERLDIKDIPVSRGRSEISDQSTGQFVELLKILILGPRKRAT